MNQDILFIILILFAYVCASTPFGYLVAKCNKIDIQKEGSGNVGATNILRKLGFGYFLLVAILDIVKVALPVIVAKYLDASDIQISVIALFAIAGNMYSFWLKFKGGKAVSSVFAILLCIIGLQNGLLFIIIWALSLYVFKIMSVTNLILIFTFPIILWIQTGSLAYTILGAIFIPIIWWTHRENIKRLAVGKEPRIIKF